MPSKKFCILKVTVCDLKAPLIYPFRIASGKHDALENVLFGIECEKGIKGFGEAAVATHITGETVAESRANLQGLSGHIIGKDIADYPSISELASKRLQRNKSALAAIEMALLDAYTRSRDLPLWKFFGKRLNRVVTDITIVISELPETKNAAKKFYRQGFRTFKVKIGRDFDYDIKRVEAIAKIAPRTRMILDANQAFSAKQALAFLGELKKLKINPILIEQPVAKADWEGLQKITRESRVKVCADESVGSFKEALFAIQHKAVDIINIKFMKTGIFEAQKIAKLAVKHNIELMLGSMMESPLSAMAAAHFAGGSGFFKYIDLDTPFFIKGDSFKNAYLGSNGVYHLRNVKQGIGIIPKMCGFIMAGCLVAMLAYPALAGLNLDTLPRKDSMMVKTLLKKLEPLINGREADSSLATLTFDELYAPLNEKEAQFLRDFQGLDAKALNVKIPYRGIATGKEPLKKIAGQRVRYINIQNGASRELGVQYLPEQVYEKYKDMMAAMQKDIGKRLLIESGYRSSAYQLYLFVFYLKNHEYSIRETVKFVALPGYSEHGAPAHQAVDFINVFGINGEDTTKEFEDLPEYHWLLKHAGEFGFVLSYPKMDQSGITFEPWHWRFDGGER